MRSSILNTAGTGQITSGQVDLTQAGFAGGAGGSLLLASSRADMRGYLLPDVGGANIDVGALTCRSASVRVEATDPNQDYFSGVRANGGKVTFDDDATYYVPVTLNSGEFHADDLVFVDDSANVIRLALGANATMDFDLGGAADPENDQIAVDGTLNTNGSSTVQITMLPGLDVGVYDLFTFPAGGFIGSTPNLLLPSLVPNVLQSIVANLQLNDVPGSATALQLNITELTIPEPCTAILFGLAGLGLLRRQR